MNVITSTAPAVVDTTNAVPPSNSNIVSNVNNDGVAFCVNLTFIVCPAVMLVAVNNVSVAKALYVKKLPNEQSIVVVPPVSVNVPTTPTAEPEMVRFGTDTSLSRDDEIFEPPITTDWLWITWLYEPPITPEPDI